MRDTLNLSNKGGPAQERRSKILDELKEIRNEQGNIKQSRSQIHNQINALQEGIDKRVSLQ